jgi:predicted porin
MNKKLLNVAVAAALVAPAAALADVTIYGQLHMSLDYTDTNTDVPAGTVPSQKKTNLGVSSNSSRIGFKGWEDLGSGLKAIWQIESLVSLDEGGSTPIPGGVRGLGGSTPSLGTNRGLGTRNTFLGLGGGFGTFLMGKHDTPFKLLGRALDPFGDSIADTRQLLGNGMNGGANSMFDVRPPNTIAYITPNFAGFNAAIAYANLDETGYLAPSGLITAGGTDNNKINAWSLNATYTNGPIFAGVAYERHDIKDFLPGSGLKDRDGWRIGGSYAFGPAKVGAMWERLQKVASQTGVDAFGNPIVDFDTHRNGGTIFGTYDFGMETVKLAYTGVGNWSGGGFNDNTKANLWALGLDHHFSKRTTAYVQYTKLTNKDNAAYDLGGGGGYGDPVQPDFGKDPSAFSLGLIHKF